MCGCVRRYVACDFGECPLKPCCCDAAVAAAAAALSTSAAIAAPQPTTLWFARVSSCGPSTARLVRSFVSLPSCEVRLPRPSRQSVGRSVGRLAVRPSLGLTAARSASGWARLPLRLLTAAADEGRRAAYAALSVLRYRQPLACCTSFARADFARSLAGSLVSSFVRLRQRRRRWRRWRWPSRDGGRHKPPVVP